VKLATVYCVECQQKLCQDCAEHHKKFSVSRRHEIVELGMSEALSLKLPLSMWHKISLLTNDSLNLLFASDL